MITCAALLATYFGGAQISDLDKSRVYEIPSTIMSQMTVAQRAVAKTCAYKHGIQYKIVYYNASAEPRS